MHANNDSQLLQQEAERIAEFLLSLGSINPVGQQKE
jgi:hypothetical protein